jgi:DNA adenine methylase
MTGPFLRWAGGKTWLIKDLEQYLPATFNNYHEPFLGGGSVFIHLKSNGLIKYRSYLSDKNRDLINSYNVVKSNSDELIECLLTFRNEKDNYYFLREQNFANRIQRAAQFIFLNRTSFNGIYRVNLRGQYNVPYGFKKYSKLIDVENFKELSYLFKNSFFKSCDFEETIQRININDLVFLDPPYTVAHENNSFVKYNQKIFAWEDQERLMNFIEQIKRKGAYFILTNAAHKSISTLFHDISKKYEMNRFSVVGGKNAGRHLISEYLFSNFNK